MIDIVKYNYDRNVIYDANNASKRHNIRSIKSINWKLLIESY